MPIQNFRRESGGLPPQVVPEVATFFALICKWLDAALQPAENPQKAAEIIAAFEGALLMSRVMRDPAILRSVVSATLKRISR